MMMAEQRFRYYRLLQVLILQRLMISLAPAEIGSLKLILALLKQRRFWSRIINMT